MRILFLCHRVPYPPDKGDKIRAFHALRAIAERHEVDLFTLADDRADLGYRDALSRYCDRVTISRVFPRIARVRSLPYLFTRTPLTVPYFYSAALEGEICRAVAQREYDRVFVYCTAMAQYVDWTSAAFRRAFSPRPVRPIPVVMDLVDVDSDKWMQYAAATRFPFSTVFRKEGRDLRAYEERVCNDAACVLLATEREAQLARQIAPAARILAISNGVDTTFFAPPAKPAVRTTSPCIVLTGDMSYFPNQDAAVFFAGEVLPLIRREVPDVRFVIVGRNPDRRVQALGQIAGVSVTGSVPDVRPWLEQATVAVAPLKIAAGVQNKILEAMASGLPVVATTRAVQGLTNRVADVVETGQTAEEIAAGVVRLLKDPQLAADRGMEGRRRVAADYSWERSYRRLLEVIDDPSRVQPGTITGESRAPDASLASA